MFTEKCLGKIVTLTFSSKSENFYNVQMHLKAENVGQFLVEQQVAVCRDDELEERPTLHDSPKVELHSSKFVRPAKIPCNLELQYDVEITSIFSPYFFYAQLSKDRDRFLAFEESLQGFYKQNGAGLVLKRPRVGQMCVARYSVDLAWYRAVIKEIDYESNTVKVFFIDYGN
jgi:hypothetical protein